MKGIILAALAAVTLAGCVAVPAYPEPAAAYYSAPAYYPAPTYYAAPSVGIYYSNRPYYRHWHRW